MPSVRDWAAKAAKQIVREQLGFARLSEKDRSRVESRVAAIIVVHAEPILALLQRKLHSNTCEAPTDDDDYDYSDTCTCGAGQWNKRVREATR